MHITLSRNTLRENQNWACGRLLDLQNDGNWFRSKNSINYLLNVDYAAFGNGDIPLTPDESYRIDPFLPYAVECWDIYVGEVDKKSDVGMEVINLTLLLLNPSRSHFQGLFEQTQLYTAQFDPAYSLPDWRVCLGAEGMAILGYACHLGLLETADAFLTQKPHLSAVDYELKLGLTFWKMGWRTNRLGTPFQISANLGKEDFARLFLNKGNMGVN